MKEKNKSEENYFKNDTLYNHHLVEILQKTLEFNEKFLEVLMQQKSLLEKAKQNGSSTKL